MIRLVCMSCLFCCCCVMVILFFMVCWVCVWWLDFVRECEDMMFKIVCFGEILIDLFV